MTYKEEFIKFMVDCGVLTFGEFTLKSGRKSPYFLNAGNYNKGSQLARLGEFYASCIVDNKLDFDTIFGPAYKGIPLSVATATALYGKFSIDVNYAFDRKEVKDHGEGGIIVGKQLQDGEKLLLIDDVTTSGKALGEVIPKIKEAANVEIVGFIITADRMEKALDSELSAAEKIKKNYGFPVYSIVNIVDIISAIESEVIQGKEFIQAMREYRSKYGVG